ncbi:tetratricopeptide repeat protein [Streptomyces tagetis]|uniref:Tetratricopeptide repeat protein n=1 Tax=Streptomyces tagetis TaxID=2820809 RepID=A0A940XKH4_9ACTN|nr:tetratricopeptide repeat protein [Streptomyces sp. RG38]MBQ0828782.1 tetratricopeptide repeat protein [Streptomyces sp. RG38]
MTRSDRDERRGPRDAVRAHATGVLPIDVRVPAGAAGVRGASVDGALVVAAPGQEIQHAVLERLHRLALAADRPVLAAVRDERVGCVVPLRVDPDGSSHLVADPTPLAPDTPDTPDTADTAAPAPNTRDTDTGPDTDTDTDTDATAWDRATQVLRLVEPVREAAAPRTAEPPGTPALRPPGTPALPPPGTPALPPPAPHSGTPPAALPRSLAVPPPGTVVPPTGRFGPPPRMEAVPGPAVAPLSPYSPAPGAPRPVPGHTPDPGTHGFHAPRPTPEPATPPPPPPTPAPRHLPPPGDDHARPTPARGFDAVAEAVLGDGPPEPPGTAPGVLAEPTARVSEAVREGRTEEAARLAERTVETASASLGPDHPEVLRLRELTAYIAYLSGDPERAFRLSLDLAGVHRRAGDAEAAYDNVRSAATAWRGVRDPERGLELGRAVLGLWDELAAEGGPAAEDTEERESAHARQTRLTARLRDRRG